MFDNIGGKLKTTAKVITWTGIVCAVFAGVSMAIAGQFIGGVIYMVVFALFFWVGSFTLYGFGELLEEAAVSRSLLYEIKAELSKQSMHGSPNGMPARNPVGQEHIPAWKRVAMQQETGAAEAAAVPVPAQEAPAATDEKICFCRKCGAKLLENAEFCVKCGQKRIG